MSRLCEGTYWLLLEKLVLLKSAWNVAAEGLVGVGCLECIVLIFLEGPAPHAFGCLSTSGWGQWTGPFQQ